MSRLIVGPPTIAAYRVVRLLVVRPRMVVPLLLMLPLLAWVGSGPAEARSPGGRDAIHEGSSVPGISSIARVPEFPRIPGLPGFGPWLQPEFVLVSSFVVPPDEETKRLQQISRSNSVEELIDAVGSGSSSVRSAALLRLGAVLERDVVRPHFRSDALAATVGALDDSSLVVRVVATRALGYQGAEAVPHLERALEAPESWVVGAAIESLGRVGVASDRTLPLLERQIFGSDLARLKRRDSYVVTNRAMVWALAQFGEAALPVVARALDHDRPEIHWIGLSAVHSLGTEARPLLPHLLRLFEERPDRPREGASILSSIESFGEPARDAIVERLGHSDPRVVMTVLRYIGSRGDPDPETVQRVEEILRGDRKELVGSAHYALIALDPSAACDYFEESLERGDSGMDVFRMTARIAECGADLTPHAPKVLALLDELNWYSRLAGLVAIRSLGTDADELTAAVVPFLQERDGVMRKEAIGTLGVLARSSDSALELLLTLLDTEDGLVRQDAAQALGEAGPRAAAAVPRFEAWIRDWRPEPRMAGKKAARGVLEDASGSAPPVISAGRALARIAPERALALFLPMLDSGDPDRVRFAVGMLSELGDGGTEMVPGLLALLKNEDCRELATHSLIRVARDRMDVQEAIVGQLASEDVFAREQVLRYLARWASDDPSLVPALVSGLEKEDPVVRAGCALLLEYARATDEESITALRRASQDPDESVRWYAALALSTLESL